MWTSINTASQICTYAIVLLSSSHCHQDPTGSFLAKQAFWHLLLTCRPSPRADRSLPHKHLFLCLQRDRSCESELRWVPPCARKAWGWRTPSLPHIHGWPTAGSCVWSWGKSTWNLNHGAKPGHPAACCGPFARLFSRQQLFWHHDTSLLTVSPLSRAPVACCYLLLCQVVPPGEGYGLRTFLLPLPVGWGTLLWLQAAKYRLKKSEGFLSWS